MPNHVEIEGFLSPARIEYAYSLACRAQVARRQSFADTGWRAALARDPKLLKALERGAEVIERMSEEQFGRTMRTAAEEEQHKYQQGTTEGQLWRNAYTTCDNGTPERSYEWIYGSAAWLCGYGS
ncbi:hypothetical protein CMI37_16585 [Candidatus Pacearchaeota archaeon]|nr:hypothetical protein [Candidatus Pacearchaeota archaeon]|tara:strand:+ start:246 stop:620 length:375 start_codon:yes stop_codon:yes gene_type:complete